MTKEPEIPTSTAIPTHRWQRSACVYAAFLTVGTGSGWCLNSALLNLVANEAELQEGGRMFGTFAFIQGITGFVMAGFHLVYMTCLPGGGSARTQQLFVFAILAVTILFFVFVTFFWRVGAPQFPVVIFGAVLSCCVGWGSWYWLLPVVASHYGGWLVAPVRTGTDVAGMLTVILGELQNPSGSHNRFPSSWPLALLGLISCCGMASWFAIVCYGLGLRADGADEAGEVDVDSGEAPSSEDFAESISTESVTSHSQDEEPVARSFGACCRKHVHALLQDVACPRSLLLPVVLATLSQVALWGIVYSIGQVGASMTDPLDCEGQQGQWVYRTSLTLSGILIPVGSFVSSLVPCPRIVFKMLSLLQNVAALAICSVVASLARPFWTQKCGQILYIACFSVASGLEGYILTMAYRYIGDDCGIPRRMRRSTSNLLGMAGVVAISTSMLLLGGLVNNGTIRCTGQQRL